jgi:hypothetical protein
MTATTRIAAILIFFAAMFAAAIGLGANAARAQGALAKGPPQVCCIYLIF